MAKIEIFSGPQCGYCESAKRLLDREGLAYVDYDVAANDSNRKELCRRLPRVRAIPQIFIDGEHIGGYDDLRLIMETGRSRNMTS